MSDKIQHTSASMREKMSLRYSDGLYHKHNKNHVPYRFHFRSHPCKTSNGFAEELGAGEPTGLIGAFKSRKIRKRLDKGKIH